MLSWAPWTLSCRPTLGKHQSSPAARKSSVGMKAASQQVSAGCSLSQWFCSATTPHPQGETVATRPVDISQVGRPDPRNANISFYDLISVPTEISRPSVASLQLVSVPFNRAPGTKENIPDVWTHTEQRAPCMQTLSERSQQRAAGLLPFLPCTQPVGLIPNLEPSISPWQPFFLESVFQAMGTVANLGLVAFHVVSLHDPQN